MQKVNILLIILYIAILMFNMQCWFHQGKSCFFLCSCRFVVIWTSGLSSLRLVLLFHWICDLLSHAYRNKLVLSWGIPIFFPFSMLHTNSKGEWNGKKRETRGKKGRLEGWDTWISWKRTSNLDKLCASDFSQGMRQKGFIFHVLTGSIHLSMVGTIAMEHLQWIVLYISGLNAAWTRTQ